jgi:hypothetical protein
MLQLLRQTGPLLLLPLLLQTPVSQVQQLPGLCSAAQNTAPHQQHLHRPLSSEPCWHLPLLLLLLLLQCWLPQPPLLVDHLLPCCCCCC